jgi:hypothetical protein
MSVSGVSSVSSILEQILGKSESSAPARPLTPAQKLEQERLEVEQLEFLGRRLGRLRALVAELREEWRSQKGMSAPRSRNLAGIVRDIFTVVNEVHTYHVPGGGEPASFLGSARDNLVKALEAADVGDVAGIARDLGVVLDPDLDEDEERIGPLLPDGRGLEKKLARALRRRYRDVKSLLFGTQGEGGGVISMLELRVDATMKVLLTTAEGRGVSLDAYA